MAEKKEKKADAESGDAGSPQEHKRRENKKSRWTQDVCRKVASRYTTREEWQLGAPSSYKAACAHGWDAACCKHMTAAKPAAKAPARKAAPAPAKVKKSA